MTWPFLFVAAMFTLNPVTVSVYPSFAMVHAASFRITVMVPRHLDNRHLCFGVTGPEDKKSCLTLDGFQARKTWTVYWTLRTAGEYQAMADLTRIEAGNERHYVSQQPFRVIGGFDSDRDGGAP